MVRAATAWFLAELAVVVRFCCLGGGRGGRRVACGRRITALRPARQADLELVNVGPNVHHNVHHQKPLDLLGPVNVVNVVNVFPLLSRMRARARPHMRKGWKNVHDVHDVHEICPGH